MDCGLSTMPYPDINFESWVESWIWTENECLNKNQIAFLFLQKGVLG